jgi:hypothetical protein
VASQVGTLLFFHFLVDVRVKLRALKFGRFNVENTKINIVYAIIIHKFYMTFIVWREILGFHETLLRINVFGWRNKVACNRMVPDSCVWLKIYSKMYWNEVGFTKKKIPPIFGSTLRL